jgi:cytochrome c oxidase assembly protein subunit 11
VAEQGEKDKRRLGLLLGAGALAMFGFGYFVLVPFYQVMCEWSGQNRVGEAAQAVNTQVDTSRLVTVEFDTNLNRLPWQFKAEKPSVQVHPGELKQVTFEVRNDKGEPVTGQAIPSYGPAYAAQFFNKLECFCFSQQTLKANEVRQMPVVFVIDPSLPADVKTITLSYTFFEVEGKKAAAAVPIKLDGNAVKKAGA